MTISALSIDVLYRPRRDAVEFVDVPELAFLVAAGHGAPEGPGFAAATQALYAVSYAAHFLVKKALGEAPRVMPLEALWWVGDDPQRAVVESVTRGERVMAETDRDQWRWQAMIVQPEPIDAAIVAEAMAQARTEEFPALDRVTFRTWQEGHCAQLLHIGPYAAEAPSLLRLQTAIAQAHLGPRGLHHEIYLGDPRHSAPEHLRTILRQPAEPL